MPHLRTGEGRLGVHRLESALGQEVGELLQGHLAEPGPLGEDGVLSRDVGRPAGEGLLDGTMRRQVTFRVQHLIVEMLPVLIVAHCRYVDVLDVRQLLLVVLPQTPARVRDGELGDDSVEERLATSELPLLSCKS